MNSDVTPYDQGSSRAVVRILIVIVSKIPGRSVVRQRKVTMHRVLGKGSDFSPEIRSRMEKGKRVGQHTFYRG